MKWIRLFSLLVVLGLTVGCEEDTNGSVNRGFYQNKALRLSNNNFGIALDDGDSLVFRYSLNHPEDPNISDDELTEVFWFQVSKNETSFTFESDEPGISDTRTAAYQRLCFCGQIDFEVINYSVTASQINQSEWQVEFKMQAKDGFNNLYPLSDKGVYSLISD